MENIQPEPTHTPSMPQSGWWKCPQSLATDPVFLRVEDDQRLPAVGLYVACIGWTLTHNSVDGWLPVAAVTYGQVLAAPSNQLVAAAGALLKAGLIVPAQVNGMDGYIVAGASRAVAERYRRQESAAEAGRASQQKQGGERQGGNKLPPKNKIDPNAAVDWSKVSTDL